MGIFPAWLNETFTISKRKRLVARYSNVVDEITQQTRFEVRDMLELIQSQTKLQGFITEYFKSINDETKALNDESK